MPRTHGPGIPYALARPAITDALYRTLAWVVSRAHSAAEEGDLRQLAR